MRPAYLPHGYREADIQETLSGIRIDYLNDEGELIRLNQYGKTDSLRITIDRDHTYDPYIVNIGRINVQVYERRTEGYDSYIVWEDADAFYLISGTVSSSELIEMARSMIE